MHTSRNVHRAGPERVRPAFTIAAGRLTAVLPAGTRLSQRSDLGVFVSVKPEKQVVDLTGVSETALLTLNSRASEAARVDGVIEDPLAIQLVDAMEVDFAKFGRTRQEIALRAASFDAHTRAYLEQHPKATVVALAEGLQTSFWRLDSAIPDGEFRWITVDLPAVVELRSRLLPKSPRITLCAQSALDYSWMDQVDPSNGVFITAEGLLMYFRREKVLELVAECARRFPGGRLLYDLLPPLLVGLSQRRGLRASRSYRVPDLPFGASATELVTLLGPLPGVGAVRAAERARRGRGRAFRARQSLGHRLPGRLSDWLNDSLTIVEFAEETPSSTLR
ncbi:MAG: class I SAM-dependent methyltransferase [Mycobacterium sp.]|nr:class I SAM-dependent methyltransferase [Mycobacterium sp.]